MVKTKVLVVRITENQDKLLDKLSKESFVKKSELVRIKLFKVKKDV